MVQTQCVNTNEGSASRRNCKRAGCQELDQDKKGKAISGEVHDAMEQKASALDDRIDSAATSGCRRGCEQAYADEMTWALQIIKSGTLKIARGNEEEGILL